LSHRAYHISHDHSLGIGRHARDEEWVDAIGQSSDRWVIVTGDDRIRRNALLRAALRQAEIQGFVLASAYQKSPLHMVASVLVRKWPEMEQQINLAKGPALFELSINYRSGFKPLPF
jgi:hypothetical protein